MNSYEQKQEARRERLEAAADRARAKSDAYLDRGDMREERSGIPFGQPILVGHHSEGRHRRAIARAQAAMNKGLEEHKRADRLASRAAAVGSGGVSSDDPDAVGKLQAKIDGAKSDQEFMKRANAVIRSAYRKGLRGADGSPLWEYYLLKIREIKPEISDSVAAKMLETDFCGRLGFPSYALQNNSANIRRMEQRITLLQSQARQASEDPTTKSYPGLCNVVENPAENRLQIVFDGKPAEDVRKELKSLGFRWAPSQGAWQRQLNNGARFAAERFLRSHGVAL